MAKGTSGRRGRRSASRRSMGRVSRGRSTRGRSGRSHIPRRRRRVRIHPALRRRIGAYFA